MRHPAAVAIAALCVIAALARPAAADSACSSTFEPSRVAGERFLSGLFAPDLTRDRYLLVVRDVLTTADADGDGMLSPADLALHRGVFAARTASAAALQVMNAD